MKKLDNVEFKVGYKLVDVRCKESLMGLCSHPQPPLVQTQTVTITAASNSLSTGISTTEVPLVQTKAFTYDSTKVRVFRQLPLSGVSQLN